MKRNIHDTAFDQIVSESQLNLLIADIGIDAVTHFVQNKNFKALGVVEMRARKKQRRIIY